MKAQFGFTFCFIFEVYVKTCNISALPTPFKALYHESWDLEGPCHLGKNMPLTLCPSLGKRGWYLSLLDWRRGCATSWRGICCSWVGKKRELCSSTQACTRIQGQGLKGFGSFSLLSPHEPLDASPGLLMWWAQRASCLPGSAKIQHRDGAEGLGRDLLWACHRFSVRFLAPLWEAFSVSRLVSKATCITVNTAGRDLSSSPSSSGSCDFNIMPFFLF